MKKMYLIGNSHLDPVWVWNWQEGLAAALTTFRSALDRMNDFPDFKFTSACAMYYRWVEKTDKSMFEEIKQRVSEGRWGIVGGQFIQPDCNLPCGETFARHALISQRYFKEKFGVAAKTGYNVDSFGHNANLPQILKKSGMDNYVFMRPMVHEGETKDTLFNWESSDGSRVCAYRIPYSYGISDTEKIKEMQKRMEDEDIDYMVFYGIGNHGGGPTIKLINGINDLHLPNAAYSIPDEYFAAQDKNDLPLVNTELQHHARGCYSASSFVKHSIRKCENNILTAEKMSALANHIVGSKYPKAGLEKAWKNVLFNTFHDIAGGCAIKSAYTDAGYLFGETMSITEQAINYALVEIAAKIDTLAGEKLPENIPGEDLSELGAPFVIFNPHAWEVKAPVILHYGCASLVTDSEGKAIPMQHLRGEYTFCEKNNKLVFNATVPPLGYIFVKIHAGGKEQTFENRLVITENSLENEKISVKFASDTGDISDFCLKATDEHIINKPCSAVLLDETISDTWAHDKKTLGTNYGSFGKPEFEIIESGPVRATLRVTTHFGNSLLVRDYSICDGSDKISVKAKVNFHEKHRTLKLSFPINDEKIISDIPFGTVTRPLYTGEEPCGMYTAAGKLCIANDGLYGYDTDNGCLRITALRSCMYADHDVPGETRDDGGEIMEQGVTEFAYDVYPFVNRADASRHAYELNAPLREVFTGNHKGTLAKKNSFIKCDNENIVITAIKQSEDSDTDDIIRFFEANGKDSKADITFFGKTLAAEVSHNEIKTLKTDGKEYNFVEWE